MRKALVTLSGAGIIASLILSSCVIKKEGDDNETPASGGSVLIGAGGKSILGQGGNSSVGGGTSTKAAECPGLVDTLKPKDGADVCSTTEVAADFSEINMLIVLDKSRSMNQQPTGYSKTKWQGAIDSIKSALKPDDTLVKYGLMLFPYVEGGDATCEVPDGTGAVLVPVGTASGTVAQINDKLANTTPSGGTPTASALDAALKYYTTGPGLTLTGAKYVLLVTDGGPNCNASIECQPETCTANLDKQPAQCGQNPGIANCCDIVNMTAGGTNPQSLCLDDQQVISRLQALSQAGISTFVVGIPGTEAYADYLDTFADAGGVPVTGKARKYYEVTDEKGLTEAFTNITTSLVRDCVVPLVKAPLDTNNINLAINCEPIAQKVGETSNWHYDEAQQSIIIEGAQCTRIETTGVNRVDVVLGCPPIIQL